MEMPTYCNGCANNKRGRCAAGKGSKKWTEHYISSARLGICFAKAIDFDAAIKELAKA